MTWTLVWQIVVLEAFSAIFFMAVISMLTTYQKSKYTEEM